MKVDILSRLEARYMRDKDEHNEPGTVVVSIFCSTDIPVFDADEPHVIHMQFDDVEQDRRGLWVFEKADAERVLDFIDDRKGNIERLVVHCFAGVSRSSAMAIALSEYLGQPEEEIYDLYNRYPYINPNRTVQRIMKEAIYERTQKDV